MSMNPGAQYRSLVVPLLFSMLGHVMFVLLVEIRFGADTAMRQLRVPAHLQLRLVEAPSLPTKSAVASVKKPLSSGSISASALVGRVSAAKSGATTDNGQPIYYEISQLDGPVLPTSAPDTSRLRQTTFSGQPIRLQLWINTLGRVERIDILQASAADQKAVADLKAMYYDTAYIPALHHGKAAAVRMSMELAFVSTSERRIVSPAGN